MTPSHSAEQAISHSTRVKLFNEPLQLTWTNVNQTTTNKPVSRLSFLSFKLLKPSCQTLDETHTCLEISVPIILKAGHQPKPFELLLGTVVIPVHDLTKHP